MSLFGRCHLDVCDGLPQCLLGNEGVQVQDGGQAAVQTNELLLIGAEVNWRRRERRQEDSEEGGEEISCLFACFPRVPRHRNVSFSVQLCDLSHPTISACERTENLDHDQWWNVDFRSIWNREKRFNSEVGQSVYKERVLCSVWVLLTHFCVSVYVCVCVRRSAERLSCWSLQTDLMLLPADVGSLDLCVCKHNNHAWYARFIFLS